MELATINLDGGKGGKIGDILRIELDDIAELHRLQGGHRRRAAPHAGGEVERIDQIGSRCCGKVRRSRTADAVYLMANDAAARNELKTPATRIHVRRFHRDRRRRAGERFTQLGRAACFLHDIFAAGGRPYKCKNRNGFQKAWPFHNFIRRIKLRPLLS